MPDLIIGLVGLSGCGKGTAADILIKKYGADYSRFSAILSDILTRLHIEHSRERFIALSECLRKTLGEDVLSYAIEKDAVLSTKSIVVIDGIRRPEDIVALEPLPFFKLIAIDVPAEVRFARMKNRGEKSGENTMSWELFLAQEQAPTEITIPTVMQRAWKTLDNTQGPDQLEAQLDACLAELGRKPLTT